MSDQYLRYCKLIVAGQDRGIDLSEFRIVFAVHQNDFEAPNNAEIRIYNLSPATIKSIRGEYNSVHLEAGYQNGNRGTIFNGTIRQLRIGRENNIDTYIDILAADGDLGYNDGFLNETLAKRTTMQERLDKISKAASVNMNIAAQPNPNDAKYWSNPSLRGKVLWGLARSEIRNIATSNDCSWSIQNGSIQMIKTTGYLSDEAVELNAATGLIGVPEQTDQGMSMRCLLNQKIRVGSTVKLNNNAINQTVLNSMTPHNQWAGLEFVSPLAPDGKYRVLVAEHHGDTRGHEWYTEIVGMAIDESGNLVMAT